jgi:hypothetical protein
VERVPVRLGATTGLGTIRLRLGAVTLQPVVVHGETPLLDPTSTAGGGNLSSDVFEALPVDRNSHALPGLLPQANLSYFGDEVNIAGSTGPENVYYVDGVNLTDPYRANTSGDLPYTFIKEVQVGTGGLEAEVGRALGGVVNVITRSGDNVFRGEGFGYFSGSALAGMWRRGLADATVQATEDYDAGLAVSGPVVRDRLWFFTAYSHAVASQDLMVPGFATQQDRRRSHLFAGKLDWEPDDRTALALTVLGDPSRQRLIAPAFTAYGSPTGLDNIDPFLGDQRQGGVAVSLRASRRTGGVLLESAVSRLGREEIRRGGSARARQEPLVQDLVTGRWSGGFGDNSTHRSVRWAMQLGATWSPVEQVLRAGLEYEDNRLDSDVHFTDPGILIRLDATHYQSVYLIASGRVRNRVLSAYLRDSWLATPHLRLNAGLRWDGQFLIGANGRLAQRITDGLQPRLGVIVLPGQWGTKLFGFAGRYYEQLPLFASATWWHVPLRNGVYFFDGDPRTGHAPLDSLDAGSHDILPEVRGLRGQHFDEVVLGLEQLVGRTVKLGLRGVHRILREVIDDGLAPGTLERILGNPGRARLAFLPRPRRIYQALEVTVRWRGAARAMYLAASYVLSRNRGNYTGLFDHDVGFALPNGKTEPDLADQVPNSDGLLPNDRTHVFKLYGVRRLGAAFGVGTVFIWQSGTPLSELGATALPAHFVNLRPRGSVGRTPALRDLGVRVTYGVPAGRGLRTRLSLELLHIASARRPVTLDQLHYAALDAEGRQTAPNPNYLRPTRYQAPMLARLGATLEF